MDGENSDWLLDYQVVRAKGGEGTNSSSLAALAAWTLMSCGYWEERRGVSAAITGQPTYKSVIGCHCFCLLLGLRLLVRGLIPISC